MKAIKLRYTRHELWRFFKAAVLSLLTGLFRIMWSVILLVLNLAMWGKSRIAEAIKGHPMVSVCVVACAGILAVVATYGQMKARLTTMQWEKDRVEMHLDSITEAYNIKPSYSRIHE